MVVKWSDGTQNIEIERLDSPSCNLSANPSLLSLALGLRRGLVTS